MEQIQNTEPVNHWKEVFTRIAWGFFFCFVNFGFFSLQYILPVIGTIMITLGFYDLRLQNRYFRMAFHVAAINCVYKVISLCILASPASQNSYFNLAGGIIGYALMLAIYLIFRKAVCQIYQQYDVTKERDPLLWISVLTLAMLIIIVTPLRYSIIVILLVLIIYIGLLVSITRIGDELYRVCGQYVVPKRKIKNYIVTLGYCILCLGFVIIISLCFHHIVPQSSERVQNEETAIREHLTGLGFPEEVLSDLSDEHVAKLQDAICVSTYSEEIVFDNADVMMATGVAIELPDTHIYFMEHMKWVKGNPVWNDGFTITGVDNYQLLDGKLLWEKGNTTYEADMNQLTCEYMTTDSLFFGQQVSKNIAGDVCFPFAVKNSRAYVFYEMTFDSDRACASNCLNYYHNSQPVMMPFYQPQQILLGGIRDYKQHYLLFNMNGYN